MYATYIAATVYRGENMQANIHRQTERQRDRQRDANRIIDNNGCLAARSQ